MTMANISNKLTYVHLYYVQSQHAVSAYFTSMQILLFGFAEQSRSLDFKIQHRHVELLSPQPLRRHYVYLAVTPHK